MTKMTDAEVAEALKLTPDWSLLNGAIQRTFHFKDFVEAMGFVNRVADAAEKAQHHPDILVRWNKVTLTVNTHDAGGITVKDFDLAKKIDAMTAPAVVAGKGRKPKPSPG
jgi:4a-hydroxytetrahydrobiopterin dehydratase